MIRSFAHSNLVQILCEKIKRSSYIPREQFFFSVYEQELVDVVERCGLNVFRRSKELADLEGPIEQILEWHKLPYDFAVQISACNPLLSIETIDSFARTYVESPHDALFAVLAKRNFFWDAQGELITPWIGSNFMDTKAVGITYEAAHCLYAGRMDLLRQGLWMGEVPFRKNAPVLFPIAEIEAFDIDYPWQFSVAEALYKTFTAQGGGETTTIWPPRDVDSRSLSMNLPTP